MNAKQVTTAKKSVCRVMCVHRGMNLREPYVVQEDVTCGGTAFFIDAMRIFGWDKVIPGKTSTEDEGRLDGIRSLLRHHGKNGCKDLRFAMTNYHVVEELADRTCLLQYPSHGRSSITAEVVYACPSLDVAILMIDPHGSHPMWFDSGDVRDFIEKIPNLKLEIEKTIKGSSQNVVAIGFPNLSNDYQLCEGCVSGRELGMIQCSLSLNGGNSGGPLLMKGKVIGICTASVTESEALGLAGPIYEIVRFFRDWAIYKDDVILKTPSWGISTSTTTPDYLEYHDIDVSIQGATLKRVLSTGALGKAGFTEKDIIVGIESDGKRYNVDNYGLVQCDWTDKRVPIEDQEFILSLTPGDITMYVFPWKQRKQMKTIQRGVEPCIIDFKVCDVHHAWNPVPYCILGGMVFMDLCMQHLEAPEDDEEEATCPPVQAIPLTHFLSETLHMESAVVITYIPQQTHVSSQNVLKLFQRVTKLNGKSIKNVLHMETLIGEAVERYNKWMKGGRKTTGKAMKDKFIVLEINDKETVYLSMEDLLVRELQDSLRQYYPCDKCQLTHMTVKHTEGEEGHGSRKRRRVAHMYV